MVNNFWQIDRYSPLLFSGHDEISDSCYFVCFYLLCSEYDLLLVCCQFFSFQIERKEITNVTHLLHIVVFIPIIVNIILRSLFSLKQTSIFLFLSMWDKTCDVCEVTIKPLMTSHEFYGQAEHFNNWRN